MEKEVEKLKRQVKYLQSELNASMRREEILLNGGGKLSAIKQRVKHTKLGKAAANPHSKTGKVIRLPRTVYRIATHPGILKEIAQKNSAGNSTEANKNGDRIEKKPVSFSDVLTLVDHNISSDAPRRLNLVVDRMESEIFKTAIEIANKEKIELRVVTLGFDDGSAIYSRLLRGRKVPKAEKISFYGCTKQANEEKTFRLEISEADMFLTQLPQTWRMDEKSERTK